MESEVCSYSPKHLTTCLISRTSTVSLPTPLPHSFCPLESCLRPSFPSLTDLNVLARSETRGKGWGEEVGGRRKEDVVAPATLGKEGMDGRSSVRVRSRRVLPVLTAAVVVRV